MDPKMVSICTEHLRKSKMQSWCSYTRDEVNLKRRQGDKYFSECLHQYLKCLKLWIHRKLKFMIINYLHKCLSVFVAQGLCRVNAYPCAPLSTTQYDTD